MVAHHKIVFHHELSNICKYFICLILGELQNKLYDLEQWLEDVDLHRNELEEKLRRADNRNSNERVN